MKKLLSYADCPVALCGMLGAWLRFRMLSSGTDEKGLYPAGQPAWIALVLLTALVLVGILLLTRRGLTLSPRPPAFSAAGAFAAAAGLIHFGVTRLTDPMLAIKAASLLGFAAAAALIAFGICLLTGRKIFSLTHLLPCLFFALMMFVQAKGASREPELSRHFLQFAAFAAAAIAFYQQWGFDVDAGNGKKCLFWRLTALYLCLIAAPGSYGLLFSGAAIYHLLCCRECPRAAS